MRRWVVWAGLALALLMAGCIDVRPTPRDLADTQAFIDQVRRGEFAAVEARLEPSLRGPAASSGLRQAAALIPAGAPTSVRVLGSRIYEEGARRDVGISRDYGFRERHVIVDVSVRREGAAPPILTGLRVVPVSPADVAAGEFRLSGRSPLAYIWLTLAIAIPLFILGTLVMLILDRRATRKWLWGLTMIFGVGQFSLNWATGQLIPTLSVGVQLFGAGVVKMNSPYAPWIVSIAIPLAAIVYWVRRYRRPPLPPVPESDQFA